MGNGIVCASFGQGGEWLSLATVDPETSLAPYRLEMTADDLGLILRGIDPAEVRRRPRYRKPAPG